MQRDQLPEPRPLVFIIGQVDNEPDIHQRLLRGIEGTLPDVDARDVPSLQFRSVPPDFVFTEKKAPREVPLLDGLLKAKWMAKHAHALPSVVVMLTPFSVDWSAAEWSRREVVLHEQHARWRAVLSTRGVKALLVAVKIGVGLGIIDQGEAGPLSTPLYLLHTGERKSNAWQQSSLPCRRCPLLLLLSLLPPRALLPPPSAPPLTHRPLRPNTPTDLMDERIISLKVLAQLSLPPPSVPDHCRLHSTQNNT